MNHKLVKQFNKIRSYKWKIKLTRPYLITSFIIHEFLWIPLLIGISAIIVAVPIFTIGKLCDGWIDRTNITIGELFMENLNIITIGDCLITL